MSQLTRDQWAALFERGKTPNSTHYTGKKSCSPDNNPWGNTDGPTEQNTVIGDKPDDLCADIAAWLDARGEAPREVGGVASKGGGS